MSDQGGNTLSGSLAKREGKRLGGQLWKKCGQRKGQFGINVYRCFVSFLIWGRLEHDFKPRKDKREKKRINKYIGAQ